MMKLECPASLIIVTASASLSQTGEERVAKAVQDELHRNCLELLRF